MVAVVVWVCVHGGMVAAVVVVGGCNPLDVYLYYELRN